ncbi:MAG: hypothetical protein GC181_05065 [Bacteroidetes bacterium]|nr:hypothetical protein [Bacteroidota bacterium]
MRKIFRRISNYYLVVKNCWFILMFVAIGYFALVSFDQGQDILRTIGFEGKGIVLRHTLMVYLAVTWWSWQSFRSSRVLLHFSYFNFWSYQPAYSLRAQVLVPRILALIPYWLLAYGIYVARGRFTSFVFILISSSIWLFVFLHYRKNIIVWIRARRPWFHGFIPDYIPIKNGTYPASFIWSKQKHWVVFRLLVVGLLFLAIYLFPVSLPRYLGSAAVVLLAFGSWLIIASLIVFLEKYLKFPLSFTIVLCLVFFSFFNNNHDIRKLNGAVAERPDLEDHFTHWVNTHLQNRDSLDVYLVMAEGGGIRSAYWTSGVIGKLNEDHPDFVNHIYAYSAVSGGALGTMVLGSVTNKSPGEISNCSRFMLSEDYLAPVTAGLTFQDMLQRFIPFPVVKFDRMRILEHSWEQGWKYCNNNQSTINWNNGFISTFANNDFPLFILNSTHVESGMRAVISNVKLNRLREGHIKDVLDTLQCDIPISTAIGLSSRFPFMTPPALLRKPNGKVWGSLVDGGYYENLGVKTMLEVYEVLKVIAVRREFPVRFHLIAIRNTKTTSREKPVRGMFELMSPMITFSNIWENTGDEALQSARNLLAAYGDNLIEIHLWRDDHENIPLGWYLSDEARMNIDRQLQKLKISAIKLNE